MQKYWNNVLDQRGSPRAGASVTVQQNGVNSTIYLDQAGTTPKTNPLTTDTRGYFEFYAAAGEYDLVASGTGFEDYEIEDGAIIGLPSADVTFVQSGIGAVEETVQTTLRRVAFAEQFGFATGATAAVNTAALQKAANAVGVAGGGTVFISTPGTYLLAAQGAHPYTASKKYVLDIQNDNVNIRIEHGVILKLADGQQTDAGGAVDIIVFRNRTGVHVHSSGRITGNTAGQTGWTGGYSQSGTKGAIINSFATTGNGNHNILIEGGQYDDHFSNPVNIDNHASGRGSRIELRNIYGFDCGEGFQVIRGDHVHLSRLLYKDTSDVAVGDGIELSECDYFVCDGCIVVGPGEGSAFDFFGCKYGTLSNFVVDGWVSAFSAATSGTPRTSEFLTIGPGVIKGCSSTAITMPAGAVTFRGIVASGLTASPFQIPTVTGAPPVVMSDCSFQGDDVSGGGSITGTRGAIIKGTTFSNWLVGLDVQAAANNATPVIVIEGNLFLDNGTGLRVNDAGFTGFAPNGRISGNGFSGNTTNFASGGATDYTNLEVNLSYGSKAVTLTSGVNNNLDIGLSRELRVTADASGSSLAGIARIARVPHKVTIINVSANPLTLLHQNTGSTATNRLLVPDGGGAINPAAGTGFVLGQWDSVECDYNYDQERWLVLRSNHVYKQDAVNTKAFANSTNAQTVLNYATLTSAASYQRGAMTSAKSTLSNVSGATVTASNLIPGGAFLIGVTTRVNTGLGTTNGTTGYSVGDGSDADLWGVVTGTAAGTASHANGAGSQSAGFTAAGAGGMSSSARSVVLTATTGNFDGTGVIEVVAHYLIVEAN